MSQAVKGGPILQGEMEIKLKYVARERLPDGRYRYRFQRLGRKTTLPSTPGSLEFAAAYNLLLSGQNPAHPSGKIKTLNQTRGTVKWLVEVYNRYMRESVKNGTMSPLTEKQRTNLLGRFANEYGQRDALHIPPKAIRVIINKWEGTPGAANNLLKSLRAMFVWAVNSGLCDTNPTDGVRKLHVKTQGFTAWTTGDLAQFRTTHPRGTQADLALMILIFTACRRSDIVKLGRQHITTIDGVKFLSFTQSKGGNDERQRVTIPILPPLMSALRSPVAGDLTFLISKQGKPFSHGGFGARFKKWCIAAGLPDRSAHGIRKAAGALLADAGCTQHEIMAIHGHSDARTSDIYTRTANRVTLAKSAMEKFEKINW
ncbi:MAG: tyrosine-type recombinase/integrase [Rhodobacteraceae bacterium]|nr:tyrosine-type recombinase/integrase [Paracoccaceae bacterium]